MVRRLQCALRGMASEVISSKPDKNDKKLNEGVEKMLKHFPLRREDKWTAGC
jgi:hypothetical protein